MESVVEMTFAPPVAGVGAAVSFFLALIAFLFVARELARLPPPAPEPPHEEPLQTKEKSMPAKQTSRAVSRLAAKVLRGGYRPSAAEIRTLAASALGQDETPEVKKVAPKKAVGKAAAKKRA